MKRTQENAIGSARSIFQPVQQKPRVDTLSYPSTLPPGLGVGQPVMKSIAPRVPVHIIWQNFSNSSSVVASASQETCPSFSQDAIVTKAHELHSAIANGNSAVISGILRRQDASEIAMVTDDQGKNALFHAIANNDLLTMDDLFSLTSRGKLVMQQSKAGMFPLSFAAGKGAVLAVIRILEINGANGHEAVIPILLASPYGAALAQGRTREGVNALTVAAWRGRAGVVRILLESEHARELAQSSHDQPVNAMEVAAAKGHVPVVNILLQSPFAAALLQAKNKLGFNVLMLAAQNGHESAVRVFLASDYAETLVKQKNNEGLNALMIAAFRNHPIVTRSLLEFGFVEEQLAGIYSGRSTIDNVIKLGFLTVAEVLMRYGAVSTRSKAVGQSMTPTGLSQ
ncbi:MAG: ankyrin repeat domain-containing protein [Oxalobacteraceae bacterium]|nr:ankyrin repeat domain-containing protein [Oxalobacteraceae bacterium]